MIDLKVSHENSIPAGIYLFKDNNRNARTRCKICSNFEKISLLVLVSTYSLLTYLLLTYLFIVNFEHIIADWDEIENMFLQTVLNKKNIEMLTLNIKFLNMISEYISKGCY